MALNAPVIPSSTSEEKGIFIGSLSEDSNGDLLLLEVLIKTVLKAGTRPFTKHRKHMLRIDVMLGDSNDSFITLFSNIIYSIG